MTKLLFLNSFDKGAKGWSALALIALFGLASTSFAENKNYIKSGGAPKSCMGQTKPAVFKVSQSAFENEEITMNEGEYGPEINIGGTRLFFFGGDQDAKSKAKDGEQAFWYMIGDECKKREPSSKKGDACAPFQDKEQGKKTNKSIVITTSGGTKLKITQIDTPMAGSGDKVSAKKIRIEGLGAPEAGQKKVLDLTSDYQKKGQNVTNSFKASAVDFGTQAVSGEIDSLVNGQYPTTAGDDQNAGLKLSKCGSGHQGKGQITNGNSAQNSTFDINGSHAYMRGQEEFFINQYQKEAAAGNGGAYGFQGKQASSGRSSGRGG